MPTKPSSGPITPMSATFRLTHLMIALALAHTSFALANPSGAQVINGSVGFSNAGNTLSITNSPNAIINWQSFSINANETTRFLQQSANSAVLNRVISGDASQILGSLSSNGKVYLINPNGILFGEGAQINVAGLVASTLNITDVDFLEGRLNFGDGLLAGDILNQASITTPEGGQVYLIGKHVSNEGTISTPGGETLLAAGETVAILDTSTPNVRMEITGTTGSATNLGSLLADSGRIGMVAAAIKQQGTVDASSVVREGGRIFLKATQGNVELAAGSHTTANGTQGGQIDVQSLLGDTLVQGDVEAVGSQVDGGSVHLLGNRVALLEQARVDVSGQINGGEILVGGDFQGKNPEVQNALVTFIDPNVSLSANAGMDGQGGKVIVWSDDTTAFYGHISATGGRVSGNGGFVEVSGHQTLAFKGTVDASATYGVNGTLLLDPTNLDIRGGSGDEESDGNATFKGFFNTYPISPVGTISSSDDTSVVYESELEGVNANISLSASNNITTSGTFSNGVTLQTNNTLSLEAGNDIKLDTPFSVSGTGTITLKAGNDISVFGLSTATAADQSIKLEAGYGAASPNSGSIYTTGGSISGYSVDLVANSGNIGASGSPIQTTASYLSAKATGSGNIYITNNSSAVKGNLYLYTNYTFNATPSTSHMNAAGNIVITNYGPTYTNDITGTNITVTANSPLTINGNITGGANGNVNLTAANTGNLVINGSVSGGSIFLAAPGGTVSGNIPAGATVYQQGTTPGTLADPCATNPDSCQSGSTGTTGSASPTGTTLPPPSDTQTTLLDDTLEVNLSILEDLDDSAILDLLNALESGISIDQLLGPNVTELERQRLLDLLAARKKASGESTTPIDGNNGNDSSKPALCNC